MKILLLTTHLDLGGIGIYIFSLAKGLVQRNHQVWVASSGGDLVASLEEQGVEHLTVNIKTKSEISPKLFFVRRQIAKIIQEQNIEIIHAHTRVAQVLAQLVSQKTDVPYVTTCHGFFKPRIFRKTFPCWGEHCVAISEAVREHLVNDLGVRKEKVSVVHNGVEIDRFSPDKFTPAQKAEFKKNYGLKTEAPVIGTVARLSSVKGQCYLISAMKRLLQDYPQLQLLLVGAGPEKKNLVEQVKALGLRQNVFFAPATLDTSCPLSVMDIFAFPSLSEGLGLAIIEAQAMGLPVVASDVGGIYTLVKDGVNGFLVHPQDPQALAEAILKLLNNKNKALEFGNRGREQAKQQFELNQMCLGIEQVYQMVLGR